MNSLYSVPFPLASNDHQDTSIRSTIRDNEFVTEDTLTLLSEYIGVNKLPLLATQLGLSASVWEHARSNFKLPDTQALYVLRMWLGRNDKEGGEGTVSELVSALELIGLSQLADE